MKCPTGNSDNDKKMAAFITKNQNSNVKIADDSSLKTLLKNT